MSDQSKESRLKQLPDWARFAIVVFLAILFGGVVFGVIVILTKIT